MQLYTVLSAIILCSVAVWTAPLADNEIELAKRAKETIMYGNQQNPPRRVKKNDPSLNKDMGKDVDLKGHVLALPARDVPESDKKVSIHSSTQTGVEKVVPTEVQSIGTNNQVISDNNVSDVTQSTTDIDPDVQDMLQGDSMTSADDDVNDEQDILQGGPMTNSDVDVADEQPGALLEDPEKENQLANWYHYLLGYGNVLDNTAYSPQDRNRYYAYRRRRSLMNYFKKHKDDSNKAVKRGKRIKRDLYDDDLYYYPYQTPNNFEDRYQGFEEPEVEESDLLAYLLSLYDRDDEEPAYEYEAPYERLVEEAEEEEPMYYPVKRQQMLSTVPGLRKRYFYPVNNEPQTHWGAFVPQQKREYLDAYDRVLRLARALDSRDEQDYYPELYEGYKKK